MNDRGCVGDSLPTEIGRCAHCRDALFAHAPVKLLEGHAGGEHLLAHVACDIKAQRLNEGWQFALEDAIDRGVAMLALLAGARDACGAR